MWSPAPAAARPYDATDWTGPAALIIGGEAEGVGPALAAWGTEEVGIPLDHGVESLNAAVAGAVILFEAARQRRLARAESDLRSSRFRINDPRGSRNSRVCSRVFVDLTDEWMVDSANGPLV